MAHQPSDTRLRRHVIGAAPDPLQHQSGLPTASSLPVAASPQGTVGLQGGESTSSAHPGGGPSTCIATNYRDRADVPKPDRPPQHPGGPPFELKR